MKKLQSFGSNRPCATVLDDFSKHFHQKNLSIFLLDGTIFMLVSPLQMDKLVEHYEKGYMMGFHFGYPDTGCHY